MKNLANIETDGLNLKQALEKFYGDTGFYSQFPVVFGWGIDFAYCGAEIPGEELSIQLFIATDNGDGTAKVEITDDAKKYLKAKKGSPSGVRQAEHIRQYLSL